MEFRLQQDVIALAQPRTRQVGSTGHTTARHYLVNRMTLAGLQPYRTSSFELPYQVAGTDYVNLAGVLPGRVRSLDPILLVAHYDTCGDQPGADDNAAAIAVWLQVLEDLKQVDHQRDILFLFPDAEEPPRFLTEHMGSSNFYLSQLEGNIHAGLVLDLVGHDVPMAGMEDLIFIFGAESHCALPELLLDTELPHGLRNIATLNRYVGDLSDHHILRKNGEAYLFLTCGRWQHYHQTSDEPAVLNYTKMNHIGKYLVNLIRKLDIRKFDQQTGDCDPLAMELTLLKRALGPYLAAQHIPLESRQDIQRFVRGWVEQFQL